LYLFKEEKKEKGKVGKDRNERGKMKRLLQKGLTPVSEIKGKNGFWLLFGVGGSTEKNETRHEKCILTGKKLSQCMK